MYKNGDIIYIRLFQQHLLRYVIYQYKGEIIDLGANWSTRYSSVDLSHYDLYTNIFRKELLKI